MEEHTPCLVVYDVEDDRARQKIADACLDYGLERFQMSAFWGKLEISRRRELFLKLQELLGKSPGRILVQPICQDDVQKRFVFQQKSEEGKAAGDWPEPGAPRPTIFKF